MKWQAFNSFLAKNGKSDDSRNNHKSKLRRQTICDPYSHIKRYPYGTSVKAPRTPEKGQIKNFTSKIEDISNERVLVPKELFVQVPRLDSLTLKKDFPVEILSKVLQEPLGEVDYGCLASGRPIRLPLRKYHTFHFENTETANGKLHRLRQQLQHQLRDRVKFDQEKCLWSLCPQLSCEQYAFKPISPTPSVTEAEHMMAKKKSDWSCSDPKYDHFSKEADNDEDPGYSFCEEEA